MDTSSRTDSSHWQTWMERWDKQQNGYLPDREERFRVMFDVLEAVVAPDFVAIDLACGPGSISQRLLARFPQARSIAVDLDPVLLWLGQHALGDGQGRLRWLEADLRDPAWHTQLGSQQVDAVMSTTALHWLPPHELVQLYQQLGDVIRPGGVFMNGDHISFDTRMPLFRKLADEKREQLEKDAFQVRGVEDWAMWWQALEREPDLKEQFAERKRRFAWRERRWPEPSLTLHTEALRCAGFAEVGVIWQHMDNYLLLARKAQ